MEQSAPHKMQSTAQHIAIAAIGHLAQHVRDRGLEKADQILAELLLVLHTNGLQMSVPPEPCREAA